MTPALTDSECFGNYWLLMLRPIGGELRAWRLRSGKSFTPEQCGDIRQAIDAQTVISFNGNGYDIWMIAAALAGYTCEQLKWLSNAVIKEQRKPWEIGIPEWKPRDHIDIMEVLPGAGSQKTYAGRIHCKRMQDLPYDPDRYLTSGEMLEVDSYCEHDLDVLGELFAAVSSQLQIRQSLSERYGIDLRSKSDAQVGEAIIKHRCEQAFNRRIYKQEIDWNFKFRYTTPSWVAYQLPQLQNALSLIQQAIFSLGPSGAVAMPPQLENFCVTVGQSTYRMGIGGLHSSEKSVCYRSDSNNVLLIPDVASYYPSLILNSGEYPPALGPMMPVVYASIKEERIADKKLEKKLPKNSPEWILAHIGNEGGKIQLNGPFGKLGSPYSVLFAPKMLIQTTITGQLALLMLIEWLEHYGIRVVSANTDGLVILCPRHLLDACKFLIAEWQKLTGLDMDNAECSALYARDVNNYVMIKADGEVKRKGVYSQAGLIEKKNPDVEICGDAVAAFLSEGVPIEYTIATCRDIRKFVTIQKVAGGAVKLWGEGPRKDMLVKNMSPILEANGWVKEGRKWHMPDERNGLSLPPVSPRIAYESCFPPQVPEYMGKVIRWYYGNNSPGPIVYNTNGNHVALSYGARPCMTLPDEFPDDIDYNWYFETCYGMLKDLGYSNAN